MFHEIRFPDDISRGARGGPERRTTIVELASGDEERNAAWANSRRRYDVSYGIRRADDLAKVVAFFEARNGRLHGFRFKDWSDYRSCLTSQVSAATDQVIGTLPKVKELGIKWAVMDDGWQTAGNAVRKAAPSASPSSEARWMSVSSGSPTGCAQYSPHSVGSWL